LIPDSFIQELLARVDITDVISRYVQLRKGGANLLGLCPFHNEKTPSFTVSPTKQFYHCFGCGAHGSAIRFLTEHTGASFPEAVRTLAGSVGMTVPEESATPAQRAARRAHRAETSRQHGILDRAQAHWSAALRQAPEAIAYLKRRGLSGEVAARYGLGWASAQRQGLAQAFEHYEDPALIESGLVVEAEDGRRHDRFRARIMFPIRNARGQLIGFGGRLIQAGEPKYLNSPETRLFSKGEELYGLFEARAGIHAEGCVLVVEGYMDVVALAQFGLGNAVATLGTATTDAHIQKLRRASEHIVFSFDGDAAGRKAAWRALHACLPRLDESVSVRFLFLPEGQDPDSYVRAYGIQALRACLKEARSLSRFMLDELQGRHDLTEVEGRAACTAEARPLFKLMPAGGYRLQLEREFARLVQLTPEELGQVLAAVPPRGTQAVAGGPAPVYRGTPAESSLDEAAGSAGARTGHASMPGDANTEPPDWWLSDRPAPEIRPARTRSRMPGPRAVRAVMPMARRLLRLLMMHPDLAARLGEQQLELLTQHPHLLLVRELIALQGSSKASHVGALLQAADPDSELASVLDELASELLSVEWPDPQAEWSDALQVIERQAIQEQCDRLVATGLHTADERRRYRELYQRLALLKGRSGDSS